MATLFVDNAVAEDLWVSVEGEQPIPDDADVIVSLEILQNLSDQDIEKRTGRLGVFLSADELADEIKAILPKLDLVALDFPSYADGRAFSKATLLRADYGFEGEVRAVGDVRIDQVDHMKRCGIDALLIHHQPTIDALIEGRDPQPPALLPTGHRRSCWPSGEKIMGEKANCMTKGISTSPLWQGYRIWIFYY